MKCYEHHPDTIKTKQILLPNYNKNHSTKQRHKNMYVDANLISVVKTIIPLLGHHHHGSITWTTSFMKAIFTGAYNNPLEQ